MAAVACAGALVSCGPPLVEVIEEIEPNETAFVISLEDDADKQQQFESVEYLEKQKVAAKRINIPTRNPFLFQMSMPARTTPQTTAQQ